MKCNRFPRSFGLSAITLVWLLSIFSCGFKPQGYGVILLSPNEDVVSTGGLVEILEKSSLNETYTISLPDSEERVEIDMWRIKLFEKREEARRYKNTYEEYKKIYARNLRDGLAIREKPDVGSDRLYKLRGGQEIKVLGKEVEEVTVGSHTGDWYHVLTKDGVEGYCFDHYLEIFNIDAAPEEETEPDLSRIREVLSKTYRPVDFEDMRENGHIRLEKFSERYGFFPDQKEKTLRVRTFDYSHEFEYENIQKQNERSYLFGGTGVELRIEDEEHITLIYSMEDNNYSPGFVLIEDLEEIREEEKERRTKLIEEMVEKGPSYHSNAYGTLRFTAEGSFQWRQFDRLVPRIIPSTEFRGGRVRFDNFPGSGVGVSYTGAFSLDFEGMQGDSPVFLYKIEGERLSIEYVSHSNIENQVVQRRNASPLIMVFFPEQ